MPTTTDEQGIDPRWQEPLDDEERELMDPSTWAWDSAEEGIPNPDVGIIFEVRFDGDTVRRLAAEARNEHRTIHALIERIVLAHVDKWASGHNDGRTTA